MLGSPFRYNIFLLIVNYIGPLTALLIAYTAIARQLWGSQAIGERTAGQEETIRAKRRVTVTVNILKYWHKIANISSS